MTLNEKLKWACRLSMLLCAGVITFNQYMAFRIQQNNFAKLVSVSTTTNMILADTRTLHAKLDRLTVGSQEPMGASEDGPHGRIIPTIRNTTKEAEQAVIEARDIMRRVDGIIADVEAGRIGAHVEASIWKGTGTITLQRN